MKTEQLQAELKKYIEFLGEDPTRSGLERTPQRFLETLKELNSGYHVDLENFLQTAVLENTSSDGMIMVKDIGFFSLCEHHLLPFFGQCHIGYIPKTKILSLSKIPQIVDIFSQRLQIQERLTTDICTFLEKATDAQGVGVVMQATHLCMSMRGIKKENTYLTSSSMRGSFKETYVQNEFHTYLDLKRLRG